jgi:hypothetical protein
MQRVRTSLVVLLMLGVAGCSGIQLARPRTPPTGLMWAFFTDSDVVLGPGAITYTRSQVACERRRYQRPDDPPCVQVVVGPGSDYYVLALPSEFDVALPDGAIGGTDRDRCGRFRTLHFLRHTLVGECEPIGVRRAQ